MEYYKNLSLENIIYTNDNGDVCEEVWKDIPGYEGYYQVSNLGSIKSLNYRNTKKEKVLKLNFNKKRGYYQVMISKNGKQKRFYIHQLVAMAFLNHVPCGFKRVVNHKNFNKLDNMAKNFEILTNRENSNQKHLKSSSQYTGVSLDKKTKKWRSKICFNNKNISLGVFENEKEASEYYQNALKAIEDGTEIIVKRRNKTSKYKNIHWHNVTKKWACIINKNKQKINLGLFDTEEEAYDYYKKALISLENGFEINIKRKEFSSKYQGVHYDKKRKKWCATLVVDKKKTHVGYTDDEREAAILRDRKILALGLDTKKLQILKKVNK